MRGGRLLREVDRFRRVRLHAESQFVGGDPRFQFAVAGPLVGMAAIELPQVFELAALPLVGDAFGRMQVEDRLAPRAKPSTLIRRRHETGPPHAAAARWLFVVVEKNHEAGQVAVFAAQAVVDPGAQAGAAAEQAPRIHHRDAADVVEPGAHAGVNHAKVVDVVSNVAIPIGNGQTALAAASPFAGQSQHGIFGHRHRREDALDRLGERLTGKARDRRLVIERVEVARTAVHEEEDHTLRAAGKLSCFRRQWIGRRRPTGKRSLRRKQAAFGQQPVKGQGSEAAAGATEKVTSARRAFKMLHDWRLPSNGRMKDEQRPSCSFFSLHPSAFQLPISLGNTFKYFFVLWGETLA